MTESSIESELEQIDEAEDSMGFEMSKSSKSGTSLAQQKEKPKQKKPKVKVIKPPKPEIKQPMLIDRRMSS